MTNAILKTPKQAAAVLGIGLNTIRKELKKPNTRIAFCKIGNRAYIDIEETRRRLTDGK